MRSLPHLPPALLLLASCASSAPETRASAPASEAESSRLDPSWRPGSEPVKIGENDDGMAVETDKGALDQREVDRVMSRQTEALVACYEQAGPAQRFAAGDVSLRLFVTSTGEVSNVLITASAVGNYDVERCLVTEGRRLRFPAPKGNKATDFEYSLRFRSSGEVHVIDWDDDVIRKDVVPLAHHLTPCGPLGPGPVRAVVYIEPGGAVASVGLASTSPLDTAASTCAVEQIRKWRLPDDREHMVRTSFMVSTLAAAPAPATRDVRGRPVKRARRRG